ncbi:putative membrane protein [Actinophytocola algeriensis]|uniref:Putative membrane protein n=1 Tax=Actinophytocola algeriensis TaxID=1768010 RepID=A0A7W7Q5T0_9PSEU|nr:putative membrane protein [Actinophytocola algeriensis]MBE1479641.1 putative membrane protein [Actinophytocola algeriensis]
MALQSSNLAAVDFGQGISSAWSTIATFVPKLLAFLLILFIGWLIAKALSKVVDKVLERVGFDRVVERGGINRMMSGSKYDASDIIAKLVYYAVLLIALQMAFGVFGSNPVSTMLTAIVAFLPKAVVAIVIIVVVGAVARAVKDLVTNALGGLSYGKLLGTLASVFIWGLGIIAALNQIGVATTVTTPVLIMVLATVGGIAVIGVGGGLVRPMQQRWEGWLDRAESEFPQAKAAAEAYQRGKEDAGRAGGPSRTQQMAHAGGARTATGPVPGTAGAQGMQGQHQRMPQGYEQHPQDPGYPRPGHTPPGRQQ